MRHWTIQHGRDGYSIVLRDIKPWALAVEHAYGWLCERTNGWLGGHGMPESFWRIPAGRPVYDRDPEWADEKGRPWLENSIPSKLSEFETKMLTVTDRRSRPLPDHSGIPISDEVARKIAPDFVSELDSIFHDD